MIVGDLRDCPFCGGDAERIDIAEGENAGGSCIACTRCLASGNVEFGRKENFVSNWNRRADTQAADEIARLREALERQCDNMAFTLNKATLPDQWYSKFSNELEQDRAALQHKEPQG